MTDSNEYVAPLALALAMIFGAGMVKSAMYRREDEHPREPRRQQKVGGEPSPREIEAQAWLQQRHQTLDIQRQHAQQVNRRWEQEVQAKGLERATRDWRE